MKKVIVFCIMVVIILIGTILYFDDAKTDNNVINEYNWSNNTSIDLSDVYNYDKDELEAGVLSIKDNKLVFLDLENNILNNYSYIGDVIIVDKIYDCDKEKSIYLTINKDGELYICDNNNFMDEEPFYKYDISDKISNIYIDYNNKCNSNVKIKNIDGEVKDIQIN